MVLLHHLMLLLKPFVYANSFHPILLVCIQILCPFCSNAERATHATVSGSRLALVFVTVRPAAENNLSDGTLVLDLQRNCFANFCRRGKRWPFNFLCGSAMYLATSVSTSLSSSSEISYTSPNKHFIAASECASDSLFTFFGKLISSLLSSVLSCTILSCGTCEHNSSNLS